MTKKRIIAVLVFAPPAVLVVGTVAFLAYFGYVFNASTEPVKDVARYAEIRSRWMLLGLVDHFPATIPAESSRTMFFSQPGFLQGGSSIQLKLILPSLRVQEIFTSSISQAKAVFVGGEINEHSNATNGIPTTSYFTNEMGDPKFPPDFSIIVLEASNLKGGFDWNHGKTAGVAISTQRNAVVYWAESW